MIKIVYKIDSDNFYYKGCGTALGSLKGDRIDKIFYVDNNDSRDSKMTKRQRELIKSDKNFIYGQCSCYDFIVYYKN